MFRKILGCLAALSIFASAPAMALQCVPYARAASGIQIFGNAKTWWGQAAGKFARGDAPKIGAVMAFKPTRSMPIGHVAMVSKIVSEREVLVDHANWSLIGGRRGHIERGARVLDVSAAGDWSQVRVWYAPMKGLGTSTYPLFGFIYKGGDA
jgi:surface antigen